MDNKKLTISEIVDFGDKLSAEDLALLVANCLNSYSFDKKGFCKAMEREHRTIQQSFMNLCLTWLEFAASEEYTYDGRNELTHNLAKEISEKVDIHRLPMI